MPTMVALSTTVLAFFAATLLIPSAAALAAADWRSLEAFVLCAVFYGFFAAISLMAVMPRLKQVNRAGVFTGSLVMWLTLIIAAIPPFLLIERLSFVHAFFEASSAAVTLGVTFYPGMQMSSAMATYRGMIAWQGGLLTILLAVYVLGRAEVGGMSNRHLRFVLHSTSTGGQRVWETFSEVFIPYVVITLLCSAALVLCEMTPGEAFNVAINIISTNGFLPFQTGASVLNSLSAEIILLIFMLVGSTSILWQKALTSRRWYLAFEQTEAPWFIATAIFVALMAAASAFIGASEAISPFRLAFNRAFDVISMMTTTGITHDTRMGLGLPFELVLALSLIGGCAYSTSGGLKMFRLQSMLRHTANEIQKLVYPHIVLRKSSDSSPEEGQRAKAIWSALFLSMTIIVGAAILFSTQGHGLAQSLGLAVGSFSSTANLVTTSLHLQPDEIPAATTLLLTSVLGILARVELLVVLAAFRRGAW